MYYERIIDQYLSEWATRATHKPVLLRGARQVGKSTAVRHLGEQFKYFVEINLEKQSDYKILFQQNLDVKRIVPQIAAMADAHYRIAKEERGGRTYTQVQLLDRDGRRHELARLHGGDHITETTLASAEEQLQSAESFKAKRA